MAMRFFRVFFVCAVVLLFIGVLKSDAQGVRYRNVTGVNDISHSLHVKDPEDVVVPKGQPATLKCTYKVLTPGGSTPTVTWLHNDVAIPPTDSRRSVQNDGSLYIPRVTEGKRPLTGSYRCKVKNDVGLVVSGEAKLQIAVLDFDIKEENITVPEYQPVILPCQVHSIPEAKIKWEYNKQILPHNNSRYVPVSSGDLLIFKTRPEDAGVYKCIVTNVVLRRTKTKMVSLIVSPPITRSEAVSFLPSNFSHNPTFTLGVKASIYCLASGWPLPRIEWLKDGVVVGNTSVLNIAAVDQASSGMYTCRASNPTDVVTQEHLIRVQQKPYFTVIPKSKSFISAGMVKLKCEAGGYPEPCVQWFKDGKKVKLGGRFKVKAGMLIMSHTFTHDEGMYQCVAMNMAGSIWTSAQVIRSSKDPPPAPTDVQCRQHDEKSICVTWRTPKSSNASAFSIYSFSESKKGCMDEKCQGTNNFFGCDDDSQIESGPEYVFLNGNYYLATNLKNSTNYTFYVRLYSNAASDDSPQVTCFTAVKGTRNLKYRFVNTTTIQLLWSEISSDIPCGKLSTTYIVQWKKENHQMVNTSYTGNLKYNISGLSPSSRYHFRVMSSSHRDENTHWVLLDIPQKPLAGNVSYFYDTLSQNAPTNPENFKVIKVEARSVTLQWYISTNNNKNPKYAICYLEVIESRPTTDSCRAENTVYSLSNVKRIDDLKPSTLYEFRIRAHNSEGLYALYSSPIEIRTHPDVPSKVLDLKSRIINESTVCLAWLPPLFTNGKLLNYIVTYTSDHNRPVDEWSSITIPVEGKKHFSCWPDPQGTTVSVMLVNLKHSEEYTIIVRAGSDNGLSNPTYPFRLKTIHNKNQSSMADGRQENITSKQKMGVFVGILLAIICIVCCVCCIILRRRCVKQRNLAHERLAASGNYHPAVARYASEGSTTQVRLENTVDHREIENLVTEERTEVPATILHLDTKGRHNLPNGSANGLKKLPVNGNLTNGHVHITENPQFNKKENGYNYKNSPQYTLFREDPNSNRIHSLKQDHRYLEVSPKRRGKCFTHYEHNGLLNGNLSDDAFAFSNEDIDLETTQLRCFDDSFIVGNHRKVSPLLGPNG